MSQNPTDKQTEAVRPISMGAFILILVFFFFSGATGLIYEVIWTRILLNVFGASLYAVATVLAAFMGGLALGSLIGGRIADKVTRPLRLYGIIEVLEAVSALLVPYMLGLFDPLYRAVYDVSQPSFMTISLIRFAACFLVLLIPTTCMGATLPLLSRFLVRRQAALGGRIGALYTVNTTGAVVGTFLAGFVLIAQLGVAGTVFLAASLGLLMGIAVIIISFRLESDSVEGWQEVLPDAETSAEEAEISPAPESKADIPDGLQDITPGIARLVLVLYGISGFVALSYQVLWSRTLPFSFDYLKNTTYSFSAMLTVFLIGLAAGSAIMSSQIDRQRSPLRLFALLQVLIGLSGVLSLHMLTGLSNALPLADAYHAESNTFSWGLAVFNIFAKTAVTIGLPTLLMGMTFPVAARICVRHLRSVGAGTGQLYAVNTLGAILGAFAAGFVLVPVFGLAKGIIFLGVVNILLGLIVFMVNPRLTPKARMGWATAALAFFLLLFFRLDTSASFQPLEPGHKLIAYEEGPLATVAVTENSIGYRSILVDGVNVAGTEPYMLTDQKSLAHLPALLLENPRKALTVGFGSGGASWSYLQYKEFEQVDCIEICESVFNMAQHLKDSNHGLLDEWDPETEPIAGRTFHNGRYRVLIDDARSYLRFTDERYDVIATDCTDLRYKSNANLYDLEYFKLCRSALTEKGMVVVWMPLAGMSEEVFTVAMRTFAEVFPDMTVWFMNNQPTHYLLLVGSNAPLDISIARMQERLSRESVQADLAGIGLQQAEKVLSCYLNYAPDLKKTFDDITTKLNTEDRPFLEFQSPKYGYGQEPMLHNLDLLRQHRSSVKPFITDGGSHPEFIEMLTRFELAVDPILDGHEHYRRTELVESSIDYLAGLAIAPEDESLQNLLKFDELTRRIERNAHDPWARMTYGRILLLKNAPREAARMLNDASEQSYNEYRFSMQAANDDDRTPMEQEDARNSAKLQLHFHRQATIALAEAFKQLDQADRAALILQQWRPLHENHPDYKKALDAIEEKAGQP